jgi:hypothetical protein
MIEQRLILFLILFSCLESTQRLCVQVSFALAALQREPFGQQTKNEYLGMFVPGNKAEYTTTAPRD